ncbi:uncharacterized protein LOC116805849 [Drosophila grimshawi]|uniref:uncharacterized protein LOC116805849 n=1 Tax=Drosophila grimshawi TaxID=7222 RepID=UPI0013EF32FB|nr:uncharacterized protein LOC116805849 [Drosophila grimshawi]
MQDQGWPITHLVEQPKPTDNESEFLEYVKQHTSIFPNGMLERRQCGEVSNLPSKHQRHMRVHYGPPALCFHYGKLVSHQHFLAQHSYSCRELHPRSFWLAACWN